MFENNGISWIRWHYCSTGQYIYCYSHKCFIPSRRPSRPTTFHAGAWMPIFPTKRSGFFFAIMDLPPSTFVTTLTLRMCGAQSESSIDLETAYSTWLFCHNRERSTTSYEPLDLGLLDQTLLAHKISFYRNRRWSGSIEMRWVMYPTSILLLHATDKLKVFFF